MGAESTSLTLDGLKSDTEYVINLYPLFPRNSASPATLTARTCESSNTTVQKFGVRKVFSVVLKKLILLFTKDALN